MQSRGLKFVGVRMPPELQDRLRAAARRQGLRPWSPIHEGRYIPRDQSGGGVPISTPRRSPCGGLAGSRRTIRRRSGRRNTASSFRA